MRKCESYKFEYFLPNCFGVHNEIIPNEMLNFGLMPLFLVKHIVVMLNPNCLKSNVTKKVPKSYYFFPGRKGGLFLIRIVKVASPNPTNIMHDKGDP